MAMALTVDEFSLDTQFSSFFEKIHPRGHLYTTEVGRREFFKFGNKIA
jgi:hypothetical protein